MRCIVGNGKAYNNVQAINKNAFVILKPVSFSGMNNVLKTMSWSAGDVILYNSWTHHSARSIIDNVVDNNTGNVYTMMHGHRGPWGSNG